MLSAEPVDTIQQQQNNIATDSLIEDVNLTVIQHPYLDELADKIRTEPIPWQVRHMPLLPLQHPTDSERLY